LVLTPQRQLAIKTRLASVVYRYTKPLNDLLQRNANESDTRLLVTDLLCDGLGYNKYTDLSTEYRVRDQYADYGLLIDGKLTALVEVKRVGLKLTDKHLNQIRTYAVNQGVRWLILTNGRVWQVWHMTQSVPPILTRVVDVDLLGPESDEVKADRLFHLGVDSFRDGLIDQLHIRQEALSPQSLYGVMLESGMLMALRRRLRAGTGLGFTDDELAGALLAAMTDA
jgi:hypothetical protein